MHLSFLFVYFYTHINRQNMAKFKVEVVRVSYATRYIEVEADSEEEVQEFEHLVYTEDGELTLAVRSNKPFEGATNEDDTDMPFYRYETAEKGKHLFMEGTDYKAIYHNGGWLILNGYKVEEKVML